MATIDELKAELAAYEAARDAILTAQSYSIAGRTLTRADLKYVQDHIDELKARISRKAISPRIAPIFLNLRG